MSEIRRGAGERSEIEALITDRYLDSLLTLAPGAGTGLIEGPDTSVAEAVRAISRRLATDLPRFHPSFRFEERLALRLASIAASMRMPLAAGGESQAASIGQIPQAPATDNWAGPTPLGVARDDDGDRDKRPLLIGSAVAASAISLAGAWLAWRRRTSPMTRAIRAAHSFRQPLGHG